MPTENAHTARTVGVVKNPDTGPRGGRGKSAQARWKPGAGQAAALTAAAKAAPGKTTRADMMRAAIHAGLTLTPEQLAALPAVPLPPTDAPLSERSITWIPEPGMTEQVDAAAEAAGITRNEAIRRYVAHHLDRQSTGSDQ